MLLKPISISQEHKVILQAYLDLIQASIKEVTKDDKEKYNNFIDISNIIIEHHNNYRDNLQTGNYLDFMNIIPTNFTCLVNGFLTGLEDKENRKKVIMYRHMLSEYSFRMIDDLQNLKILKQIYYSLEDLIKLSYEVNSGL